MKKINIFICVANEDLAYAKELERIFSNCYGFQVFLYDKSIIPSDDFQIEIIENLKSCEIFVPLVSASLKKSAFCNQEIGFAVSRNYKIFPISIDDTEPYGLIDHVKRLKYDPTEIFGLLKAATDFFHNVMCHENFINFKERSINGLVEALKESPNTLTTTGIVYMFEMTVDEITLSEKHIKDILWSMKNNQSIFDAGEYYDRLKRFMKKKYSKSID